MPHAITPTFSPWTHTSDDSYIYQLSLVLATAIVSYGSSEWASVVVLPRMTFKERPVITWVQAVGTYLYYLGGVS